MSWRETLNLSKLFIGSKEIETQFHETVISIGGEISNTRNVQVKFNHPSGLTVAGDSVTADFYISDDPNGSSLAAVAPNLGISSVGHMLEEVADLAGKIITPAGLATFPPNVSISIKDSGAKTFYLVVIQKCGQITVSGPITFT